MTDSEVTTEDESEVPETEEEVEPTYVCGWMVALRKDGNGIQFDPIQNNDFERVGTLTDLNMVSNHLADHTRAIMAASRSAEIFDKMFNKKTIIKKIH